MSIQSVPMIRVVLPFIIGLCLNYFFSDWVKIDSYVIFFSWVVLAIISYNRFLSPLKAASAGVIMIGVIICWGYWRGAFFFKKQLQFSNSKKKIYKLKILKQKAKNEVLTLVVGIEWTSVSKKFVSSSKGYLLIHIKKTSQREQLIPGRIIWVEGYTTTIPPPQAPFNFDQQKYWQNKGVYAQMWIKDQQILDVEPIGKLNWRAILWQLQINAKRVISTSLKKENAGVATALLLGSKMLIDRDLKQAYINSGTIHVLAVSGLHVGFILLFLDGLLDILSRVIPIPKSIRTLLVIFGIGAFAMLTGSSPSVCRSVLMFSFWKVGTLFRQKNNGLNSVLLSAFILLWINPFLLFDVGFQLSYSAVLGILIFQPLISCIWAVENKIVKYLWGLITVSLAAQLTTLPLSLFYFHQFPIYFIFGSIVVIPLSAIILFLGIGLFILQFWTSIHSLIADVMDICINLTNHFVGMIQDFPNSSLMVYQFSLAELIIYYLLLSQLYFWLKKSKNSGWYMIVLLSSLILFSRINMVIQNKLDKEVIAVYSVKGKLAIHLIHQAESIFLTYANLDTKQIDYLKSGMESRYPIKHTSKLVLKAETTSLTTWHYECLIINEDTDFIPAKKEASKRYLFIVVGKSDSLINYCKAHDEDTHTIIVDVNGELANESLSCKYFNLKKIGIFKSAFHKLN